MERPVVLAAHGYHTTGHGTGTLTVTCDCGASFTGSQQLVDLLVAQHHDDAVAAALAADLAKADLPENGTEPGDPTVGKEAEPLPADVHP